MVRSASVLISPRLAVPNLQLPGDLLIVAYPGIIVAMVYGAPATRLRRNYADPSAWVQRDSDGPHTGRPLRHLRRMAACGMNMISSTLVVQHPFIIRPDAHAPVRGRYLTTADLAAHLMMIVTILLRAKGRLIE